MPVQQALLQLLHEQAPIAHPKALPNKQSLTFQGYNKAVVPQRQRQQAFAKSPTQSSTCYNNNAAAANEQGC